LKKTNRFKTEEKDCNNPISHITTSFLHYTDFTITSESEKNPKIPKKKTPAKMHFEYLATEIITTVFVHCTSVNDVLALSSTCKRFRSIYSHPSSRLRILQHATESQYGPLADAIQLITHNASQPAHIHRSVPFSLALLKQIVRYGRTAEKWCNIYPFKKWKHNFEERRLLTGDEKWRLRRALYRIWLYSRAFHNRGHPREHRMTLAHVHERAELLHNWSTVELAEIADVHAVMREVVHANVCPSNGSISRKFKKRFPEGEYGQQQLLFNIHLNYPAPPNPFAPPALPPSEYHSPPPTHNILDSFHSSQTHASKYASHHRFALTGHHDPGSEGWGDDIHHYYVVEDMLKLDPEQLLWLKEKAPLRAQVEAFVQGLGRDWFENNGETWGQTLEWVLRERGEDVGGVFEAVREGDLGIAVLDE
jgi:hypothetical protein